MGHKIFIRKKPSTPLSTCQKPIQGTTASCRSKHFRIHYNMLFPPPTSLIARLPSHAAISKPKLKAPIIWSIFLNLYCSKPSLYSLATDIDCLPITLLLVSVTGFITHTTPSIRTVEENCWDYMVRIQTL